MADDLYAGFTVGSKPLSSLRVIDLKSELDKRSLSKSGSKKDLQERLKRQLQLERLQESAEHNADRVPNLSLQDDAIGTQNEVVKQYLAAQQKTYEIQKEARRQIELSADEVGGSETDASSSQDEGHSPLKLSVMKLRAAHQTVKELKESEVVSSEVEEAEDLSDKSHKRSRKTLGNDDDNEKSIDSERPREREVIVEEAKDFSSKKEIDSGEEQAENLTTSKKSSSPPRSPQPQKEEIDKARLETKENEEVTPKIDEAEIQNDQNNRLQNITDSEMAVAIESISAIAPPSHYTPAEESVSQEPVTKANQESAIKASEKSVKDSEEAVVGISEEPVLEAVVPVSEKPLIEVNEKPLIEVSEKPLVKVSEEPIVIEKEPLKESQENKEETLVEETNTIKETPVEKMDTQEIDQPKVPLSDEKAEISEIEVSKAEDMVKKSKSKTQVKSEREIAEIKKENTPPPSIRLEDEVRTKDTPSKKKVKAENELSSEQKAEELSPEANETPKVEVKSAEDVKDNEEIPVKMENVNGAKDNVKAEEVAKVEGRVTRRRKRSSETEEESPGGSEKRSRSGSRSSASRSSSAASYRSGSGSFSSPQRRRKKRIRNTDSEASSSSDDDRIKAGRGKSGSSLSSKQTKTEGSPPRTVEPAASEAVASVGKRRKWTNASSTESNEIPSLERRKINRGSTVASTPETSAKEEKEAAVEIPKEDERKKEDEPESSEKEKEAEKLRESEEAADKKDTLVLDLHATDETMGVSDNEKDLVVETKTTHSTIDKKNVENAKTESAKDSTSTVEASVERVKKITNRKISLTGSTSKEEESGSSKPARKRKWGSISKVVPVSSPVISTESLKGLIPDLAPALSSASMADDIVSNKSYSLVESSSSLRRNNQDNNLSLTNVSDKTETSKGGTEEGGASGKPREVSPARKPVSNILYVRNLVRPFTLNQLKDILGQTGTLVEDGFWIDKIKSKCYVTYETEEQAIETRLALHNSRWPTSNPKTLFVDFSNVEELEFQKGGAKPIPPPPTNAPKVETPKEHHPRDSNRKISESSGAGGAERTRRTSINEDKKRERGGRRISESNTGASQHAPAHPIREWDRDKIVQEERGSRYRDRGGDRRGGGGGGDQRNNRENEKPSAAGGGGSKERNAKDRRDKKVSGGASGETKKKVEETPGKLLDDLFRKTKAAPCIYWLPLTEQQIIVRDEQRKQRMLEREKRRQRIEQEERDRLENERKMRLKERDNRINRDRNPGRRSRSASRSPIRRR